MIIVFLTNRIKVIFVFVTENVSKLKKLEYLNLALNNIERIENLEGKIFLKDIFLFLFYMGILGWIIKDKEIIDYQIRPLTKVISYYLT